MTISLVGIFKNVANEKYTSNRNQWRKSYPIGLPKRPPRLVSLSKVGLDGVIRNSVLDLNQTVRHRDAYRLKSDLSTIDFGEYDEGLIDFDNETSKAFNYNFTFSSNPTVVFSMGTGIDPTTENVNIYGVSRSTTGSVVALSAPYSGSIRYRAAYSDTYPRYFFGTVDSIAPTLGAFKASVDVEVPDNASFITASWSALSGVPVAIYASPYDDGGNSDADVALEASAGTLTMTGVVYEISAPISSSIYILAIE